MTHLNIQQGQNVEVVTTQIIKKLYEAALSVPEPLEGEQDAAYMSGNLQVAKTYRSQVEYLTNRFDDLHINVTDSYYIPFEDSAVLNVLLANNIGSDGIGVTEAEAANATLTSAMFKNNTDITSFDEFKYFTKANTNPPNQLFLGCSNLSSIDLSNVTTLSNEEFKQTALTNIVLPENITTISSNCFQLTSSLLSVSAPGVQVINDRAFDYCTGLTSFSDFSNVTAIGQNAFLNAPLTGVFNAPNLTALGTYAFQGHRFEGIECIGTISSMPDCCFGSNIVYNTLQYVYLPYECTQLGNYSFARAITLLTIKQYDKTISDYQEGETKTFLPNLGKITVFGSGCFRECKTLTLTGDDITNATIIGELAFYQCYSLTGTLNLPNLTSLGSGAFHQTGITSVDLTGSTITSIPQNCFNSCTALTSVTIPSTVATIKNNAFVSCGITSIPDLSNIISLENGSFEKHPDWEFVVNLANVTDLGQVAIGRTNGKCRIKQIYIPKVTHTYDNGYYTNIVYYRGAFCGLDSDLIYLRDIQVLHPGDFGNTACSNLVINNTTPPVWNNNGDKQDSEVPNNAQSRTLVFEHSNITRIYVPDSAVTTYQNDTYWSTLADKIQPLSQLTKVATEADLQANQIALIEAYM